MMRNLLHPFTLISVIILLLAAGLLWFLPTQFAHRFKVEIEAETGRSLSIENAGWSLTPQPSLILRGVELAGVSALSKPILKADKVLLPFSEFGFSKDLQLENVDVNIVLENSGHSNVLIVGETDEQLHSLRNISIKNGHFHFQNMQTQRGIDIANIAGNFKFYETANIEGEGSADFNGQRLQFTLGTASLQRLLNEGGPFDLSLSDTYSQASFDGRLALQSGFSLAGVAEIESQDFSKLLRWTGIDFPELKAKHKFNLKGKLTSNGAQVSITDAQLKLDEMNAKGNIVADAGDQHPKISTSLGVDLLDLNVLRDEKLEGWNVKNFDAAQFTALDLDFNLVANQIQFGGLKSGPAKMSGSLVDAKLNMHFESDAGANLNLQLSTATPISNVKVQAQFEKLDAAMFGAKGSWSTEAELTAEGASEAELISKLTGTAKMKTEGLVLQRRNISGSANLNVADGIATIAESQFTSGADKFTAKGEIDILRSAISILAEPTPKRRILIHGPWHSPQISEIESAVQ